MSAVYAIYSNYLIVVVRWLCLETESVGRKLINDVPYNTSVLMVSTKFIEDKFDVTTGIVQTFFYWNLTTILVTVNLEMNSLFIKFKILVDKNIC